MNDLYAIKIWFINCLQIASKDVRSDIDIILSNCMCLENVIACMEIDSL